VIDPNILAQDARSLPPLSQTFMEVMRLLRQRDISVSVLEKTILRDASLTANLLRVANSSWYGLNRQVSSLAHAITLIGLKRVEELTVAMSYQAALPAQLPGYGLSRSGFLMHSIAVGFLSERIGKTIAPDSTEPLFIAGLLHDIGKLVLARFLGEQETTLKSKIANNLTLIAVERDILGTDHAEIGTLVGKAWQLPDEVTQVAVGHHDPNAYVGNPYSKLVDIVHVADITAHAVGYGQDVSGLARSPNPDTFHRLGIRTNVIEHVVSECLDEIVTACRAATTEDSQQ
jgi:putative nucleotidyltransferase with HDIG domain